MLTENSPIVPVTKTFLPPQEEYNAILKRAWDKQWLTNRGELVLELEQKLKEFLKVPNIILTTNGTLPMQIALKALGITGEVITTPFSYVATTAVIVWENSTPVFVDIDPEHLTIDENKIEAAITPRTQAILATHVYGNPCNIEAIEEIAQKHNLKVIYDAAHCFGVQYKGKSIFEYGDLSTCSFHATKIFHTGEGGAIFCNNQELHERLYYHHNFGHKNQIEFKGLGLNAKMSELQAALGLSLLPYLSEIFRTREELVRVYTKAFQNTAIRLLKIRDNSTWNFSYFPIILPSFDCLEDVLKRLSDKNVYPRRYFYPSLNTVESYKGNVCPVSENISRRVLCLPLFTELTEKMVRSIIKEILLTL